MSHYHEYQGTEAALPLSCSMPVAAKTRAKKLTNVEKASKASTTRSAALKQNGLARPTSGTATGRVWDVADMISEQLGEPATRGAVIKQLVSEGVNAATAATHYGRWRKYNGLIGEAAPGRGKKVVVEDASFAPEEIME